MVNDEETVHLTIRVERSLRESIRRLFGNERIEILRKYLRNLVRKHDN